MKKNLNNVNILNNKNNKLIKEKEKMKITKKLLINGSLSLTMAVASVIAILPKNADAEKTTQQLENEIQALQSQINDAESQAKNLRDKAKTLQAELAGIEKEKSLIQSQLQISQAQYEKLQKEIKETEENINNNKSALGTILADISLEENITPLERIAGSSNLSQALDHLEYQSSIKDQLVEKVEAIKKDKKRLESKRDEVKLTLENQKTANKALQEKINQQNTLLAKTNGEEAEYSKYAKERGEEKLKLQQEQQELIQRQIRQASGGQIPALLGGTTAYPWNDSNCYVDANAWSWGGYDGNGNDDMGYGCRQCVSYTAWRLLKEKGIRALWWGNANMWPASARRAGFRTGRDPKVGSIGVIMRGAYGHVVWIDSIEGNYVWVSQYNYGGPQGWGHFSRMRVPASTYDTYIYFD